MLKKILIIVSFTICISINFCIAQTETDSFSNNIYVTKYYRAGFYTNHSEFLTNSPSIKEKVIIKERLSSYIKSTGGGFYIIDRFDKEGNTYEDQVLLKKLIKSTWGYCDGSNIYIFDHLIKKNQTTASKILLIDKISVIEHYDIATAKNSNLAIGMAFGMVGVLIANSMEGDVRNKNISKSDTSGLNNIFRPGFTYLLDNTSQGKLSYFYYQTVLEILYYKDRELYEMFIKEPKQERIGLLSYYVILFNKRNQDKY